MRSSSAIAMSDEGKRVSTSFDEGAGSTVRARACLMMGIRSTGRGRLNSPLRLLTGSLNLATSARNLSVASVSDFIASARNPSRSNCCSILLTRSESARIEFFKSCVRMAESRMKDSNCRDSASRAICSRKRSVIALKVSASKRVSSDERTSIRSSSLPPAMVTAPCVTRSMLRAVRRKLSINTVSINRPTRIVRPVHNQPTQRKSRTAAVSSPATATERSSSLRD